MNQSGFKSKRHISNLTADIGFPPRAVFPLLCPVREYEWLEGWKCELIYSESGVAEEGCVFKTAHGGGMIWSVSRYEPPARIEFTTFVPGMVVTQLHISLAPTAQGTRLQWTRIFTGLSEAGNETVGTWDTAIDARLTMQLEHFLKTGTMLLGVAG